MFLKGSLNTLSREWQRIPLWTAEQTAEEILRRGYPFITDNFEETIYSKDFVLALMAENDPVQLRFLVKATGKIPQADIMNLGDLFAHIKRVDKQYPGYLLKLFYRFAPIPDKNNYSTQFFRSVDYWQRQPAFKDVFEKTIQKFVRRK